MRITKSSIIALLVGLLLIAGVSIWYKLGIEPGIPVWAEGERAVEWPRDRLPLKVWCESDQDDCHAAIDLWVDAAGCPLLLWTEHGPDGADIRIVNGSANDPERGDAWEKTFASKTGDRVNYIEVRLYEPPISLSSPYSMRYAVNVHGISHGLGLAHTTFGITRTVLSGTDPYPRVVDKHGRALRERYCQP